MVCVKKVPMILCICQKYHEKALTFGMHLHTEILVASVRKGAYLRGRLLSGALSFGTLWYDVGLAVHYAVRNNVQ